MRTGDLLRKSLNYKEELKGQLGERLPVAMRIFAAASKEAGLTANGTTQELFKQMELGKVSAEKILPHVAKGFRKWAQQNKALEKSMARLSVQFGRAQFDLQTFQNTLFKKGVENGLKILLTSFDELMKSSEVLAAFLGGAFKGAIWGLVTPFRLLHAVIHDLAVGAVHLWTVLGGSYQKDSVDSVIGGIGGITAGVVALVASLWAVKKAFGALRNMGRFLTGANKAKGKVVDAVSDLLDDDGRVGKGKGKGKGLFGRGGQRVFVTNMPRGGFGGDSGRRGRRGKGGMGGKLLGMGMLGAEVSSLLGLSTATLTSATAALSAVALPAAALAGVTYLGIEALPDSMKYDQAKPPTAYRQGSDSYGNNSSSNYQQPPPQKVEVEVKLDSNLLRAEVDNAVSDGVGTVMNGVYNF